VGVPYAPKMHDLMRDDEFERLTVQAHHDLQATWDRVCQR
jgi:hypothetical protein